MAAPAEANVGVRIRTWYGQRFHVLDSSRDPASCRIEASQSLCALAFPRLEAQQPGVWTVIVFKRSVPPARVRVAVIFNKE